MAYHRPFIVANISLLGTYIDPHYPHSCKRVCIAILTDDVTMRNHLINNRQVLVNSLNFLINSQL